MPCSHAENTRPGVWDLFCWTDLVAPSGHQWSPVFSSAGTTCPRSSSAQTWWGPQTDWCTPGSHTQNNPCNPDLQCIICLQKGFMQRLYMAVQQSVGKPLSSLLMQSETWTWFSYRNVMAMSLQWLVIFIGMFWIQSLFTVQVSFLNSVCKSCSSCGWIFSMCRVWY